MGTTRARKQIDTALRAIFYANLREGLRANLPVDDYDHRVRWLTKHGISRGHAQRLAKFADESDMSAVQGPGLDLVGALAKAFGVRARDMLDDGCRFTRIDGQKDSAPEAEDSSPREGLQRSRGRGAAGRRSA